MSPGTALVVLIVLVALLSSILFGGRLPQPFQSRGCQGKLWRREFPNVSKQEIRAFLSLFAGAFAFRQSERLKLNPNDPILAVYRAVDPHVGTTDMLELETLAVDVEKKYGIDFDLIWSDELTLGELFAHVQRLPLAAGVSAVQAPGIVG
ncbi:MAG TPA: hypothetical protein VH988_27410 [Thermoanaerobaculia bacterium]|jgi:hypothetical protein|nr:hypothetical protein [Thermoanaerobaculia bacterium]